MKYECEYVEAVRNPMNDNIIRWAIVKMGENDQQYLARECDMPDAMQWVIALVKDDHDYYTLVAWGCADDGSSDTDVGHNYSEVNLGYHKLTEEDMINQFNEWVIKGMGNGLME